MNFIASSAASLNGNKDLRELHSNQMSSGFIVYTTVDEKPNGHSKISQQRIARKDQPDTNNCCKPRSGASIEFRIKVSFRVNRNRTSACCEKKIYCIQNLKKKQLIEN